MPAVTEPAKDAGKRRAQQILDAAELLLVDEGYEGLTAQAVARRAGVNKALVFYYWGSTGSLFERVLERYYARHRQALVEALSTGGSLHQRAHHIIDAYLDYMEANRGYVRLVQQQVAGRGPHLPTVQHHLASLMEVATDALSSVAPAHGPASVRHLYLSLSAIVVNYFTYAPALGDAWGEDDPLSAAGLEERRAHVHWVIDAWLDRLLASGESTSAHQTPP